MLDVDRPTPIAAIAAELGVSPATVKRLLADALAVVAAAMPDLDPDYFSSENAAFFDAREPVIPKRAQARQMKINPTFLCMIAELKCERNITAAHEQQLDAAAATGDSTRFRDELERIKATAPEHDAGSEPDAFEIHKRNPNLATFMRWTRVEAKLETHEPGQVAPSRPITADDIRKHGLRTVAVLSNLRELADATAARGE